MPDLVWRPALRKALRDAATEVLEKMFFIRVLGDPLAAAELARRAPASSSEGEIAARVTFHGEPSGALSLRLNYRAARAIAADFLGEEEPELSKQQVEEVVGELANMVCGAVLSNVESAASFRLDQPAMLDAGAADNREPEAATHVLPIGSGALTVKMWMEAPACGPTEKSAS
jgi:CheY-specific phosphatase CheX